MCIETINSMADTIAELEQELDKHRWIPVEERLPDKTDIYLITFGKYETARAVIASHYLDGEWLSLDHGYVFGTVKAWTPMPEPYKGGEE